MLDITAFQKSFKGDISRPGDEDYEVAIARWAINSQKRAEVVAFVKDAQDVALALSYVQENKIPFAIRGGGHSTAGASSSEGLVIDLSRYLNTVEIDKDAKLAYVGGGAVWEAVDKAAIQHGLASVGGTVNHTGVGGLTLGGGIGWLTGTHGLVIDNLVEATVVTSDGLILKANASENSDLFWAIRGGGSNFGIVVQFVFKLHPQRRTIYAGLLTFSADVLEDLVKLTTKWWETVKPNEGMFQIMFKAPQGPPVPMIVLFLFYNGSEAEGRANFKSFLDLGPLADSTKEIPYEELNSLQNGFAHHGQGRLLKGSFHAQPDVASIKKVLEKITTLPPGEHDCTVICEYYPLQKIRTVPNESCAFDRDSIEGNATVLTSWTTNSPENVAIGRRISREVTEIIVSGQKGKVDGVNEGYGNYDQDGVDSGGVDKAKILFAKNYPRLQLLKKKYDPKNIFSSWFPIVPAA